MEMRGVEPLSENSSPELSPSADCVLTFPPLTARRQAERFSSFMLRMHGKAYMHSFPAIMTPMTALAGKAGRRHCLSGSESVTVVVSSL